MAKLSKPFITRIQAEGTAAEKLSEQSEVYRKASELVKKMPTDQANRLVYVRNLLTKSLRGEVDTEAFKLFAKMTGCWDEIDICASRAMMLNKKEKKRQI